MHGGHPEIVRLFQAYINLGSIVTMAKVPKILSSTQNDGVKR